VGDAVGLSPVITFVALVFWAWVLGPLGTILAIPVTLLVKSTLIDIDPGAGWLSALMHVYTGNRRRTKSRPVAS
jgi:predicted PurR-regulated permease PerM